jgi:hypothetical protein
MDPNKYWTQYLPKIIEIYNNFSHSSTKMAPNIIENGTIQDINNSVAKILNFNTI